jgi:hypothetical protein
MHKYHGLAQFGFFHKVTYEHILQLTKHYQIVNQLQQREYGNKP